MILRCMHAELIKLKRSFIWIVFFLLPVISTVMGCFNYMQNLSILNGEWYSLWTQTTLFYSNFFFAPLIAVYCAYLWRLENFNHNRNALMSAPVPPSCLYGAQFLTIALVTLLTQLWVGILYIAAGLLCGLPGFPPPEVLFWLLRGCIGGLAVAAIQLLLSCLIRSFALPVAIALLAGIGGLLISNKGWGMYYPYSLMMLGMNSNRDEDVLAGMSGNFYASCAVFAVVFLVIGIGYLRRADVKA